jgi:hypothetical protein
MMSQQGLIGHVAGIRTMPTLILTRWIIEVDDERDTREKNHDTTEERRWWTAQNA